MSRIVTLVGGLLVVIGLTAGCSAAAEEPIGLNASPTATKSPAPAPTPTDGPEDMSDPEVGIVFEDIPAVTGDAADVHNWMSAVEVEQWRSLTTTIVSASLSAYASGTVQEDMQVTVNSNKAKGNVMGGVLRVRIGDIRVDGDTAKGTACRNYTDVTFADAERTYTVQEVGRDQPRLMEMTLARVSGEDRWTVQTLGWNGTC